MDYKKGGHIIKQKLSSSLFDWKELIEYNGSQNVFVNEKISTTPDLSMLTVKQLQAELAAAKAEINRLQQQNASLLERLAQDPPTIVPTCVSTAAVSCSPASHSSLQLKLSTKPSKSKYAPPLPSQTAAAHTFGSPSTNQGFKYLYLSIQPPLSIRQICSLLRRLHINSNRVLDIHYPDRYLVALLIHNNYEAEVRSQLEKFKIPLHNNYDSLDPNNLRDPYYDDFDQDEKECAAWSVFA
ncbi:hypothetical protein G6F43_002232 [Rhizopus delemar]|nr:hypothetical protein G6F43_002232 [Rhizopus delemar]